MLGLKSGEGGHVYFLRYIRVYRLPIKGKSSTRRLDQIMGSPFNHRGHGGG